MRPRPDQILDYREFPVLYVDDEVENLRIFELTFRREFSIRTAQSGDEALEILNHEPIAIVLSDQKMPGMLGTEFLARAADIDAKTIRVLVTAYGDAATLEKAINTGSIYRYVPKPWSPDDIRLTVRRGIEVYALDRERDHLVRELTLLNRVASSVSRELDLGSLQSLLLKTICKDFGYDAAGILLFESGDSRADWILDEEADSEVSRSVCEIRIDSKSAPEFCAALESGRTQSLVYADITDYELPVRKWVTEVSAEEILVVPLVGAKGLRGALWCDNRRGGGSFTSEDRTLLEGLSNHAVIAMENARLVEDLRRSREQVMRFERLGTLGTLAAGLAHEINNPLVSIHTFLSMAPAKRNEDDPEFWSGYHSLASAEVERIRRLVETMRQLGRDNSESMDRVPVDMSDVAEQVLQLLAPGARKADVAVELDSDSSCSKVLAIRDHMHQLIMNLLLNAIDATPKGGRVVLRLIDDPASQMAGFEISDEGAGISEEDLEQIFDPFFTTKGPDQGTGLGLMICHRIVCDHNGTIEVRNEEGGGAKFTVRLPLS